MDKVSLCSRAVGNAEFGKILAYDTSSYSCSKFNFIHDISTYFPTFYFVFKILDWHNFLRSRQSAADRGGNTQKENESIYHGRE